MLTAWLGGIVDLAQTETHARIPFLSLAGNSMPQPTMRTFADDGYATLLRPLRQAAHPQRIARRINTLRKNRSREPLETETHRSVPRKTIKAEPKSDNRCRLATTISTGRSRLQD